MFLHRLISPKSWYRSVSTISPLGNAFNSRAQNHNNFDRRGKDNVVNILGNVIKKKVDPIILLIWLCNIRVYQYLFKYKLGLIYVDCRQFNYPFQLHFKTLVIDKNTVDNMLDLPNH